MWRAEDRVRSDAQFAFTVDTDIAKSFLLGTISFNRLDAAFFWSCVAGILVFPNGQMPPIGWFRAFVLDANEDVFLTVWQVLGTLLGFFVALVALVLQMIASEQGYDSRVLPFLIRRVKLTPITVVTSLGLILNFFTATPDAAGSLAPFLKFATFETLVFSVLSALFMFVQIKDLLNAKSILVGLRQQALEQLPQAFANEVVIRTAQNIFQTECERLQIENRWWSRGGEAGEIRPDKSGIIVDVDLWRLSRFTAMLRGQLGQAVKARLFVRMGQPMPTVIAQVSPGDNSEEVCGQLFRSVIVRDLRSR